MTPALWIALAYGVVSVVLLVYVTRLRRRLRALERAARGEPHRPVAHPARPR